MPRIIWRGFLSRKLRSALTAVAILLGVSMISGTFVLTDKINGAFTDIFQAGNKKTCFKVQVPATATYRKTTTPNLGCITTTR